VGRERKGDEGRKRSKEDEGESRRVLIDSQKRRGAKRGDYTRSGDCLNLRWILLRACPGNGITLRGNLWVTPGIFAAAKPRATLLVYDSARQTLSLFSFFLSSL